MRLAGHVAWVREDRKVNKVLVGKPEGKRPFGDRGVDGIRMDLGETGWGGGVWSGFNWLRTGAGGWLLWMRWWTFGFWRHGVSCCTVSVQSTVKCSECRKQQAGPTTGESPLDTQTLVSSESSAGGGGHYSSSTINPLKAINSFLIESGEGAYTGRGRSPFSHGLCLNYIIYVKKIPRR
jgi:hypothetical protein